jgi:hypothetical protein
MREHCLYMTPRHCPHVLKYMHPTLKKHFDEGRLQDAMEATDAFDELPTLSADAGPLHPFDGIQTHHGIKCLHCPTVLIKEGSMCKHHLKAHNQHSMPKAWPQCQLQRLSNHPGEASKFFEVAVTEHQPPIRSVGDLVDNLQAEVSQVLTVNVMALNARSISPWLLTTRWHEHIHGYDTQELLGLIVLPKESEFPGLKSLLLRYMVEATRLIGVTSELALQRLNTPDPFKG